VRFRSTAVARPAVRGLAALGLAIVALIACGTGEAGGGGGFGGGGPAGSGGGGGAAAPDSAGEQRAIAAAKLPVCPQTGAGPAVGAGPRLPAVTVECLGAGPAVTLSELPATAGRPLLVNVWASWCLPCADEMPRLIEAAHDYAGRLDVLGLDMLDDRIAALEWARQLGVNFPSLYDHDGLVRTELPIPGPPITFFVSGDGRLVHTEFGEIDSAAELSTLIEQHLGVTR